MTSNASHTDGHYGGFQEVAARCRSGLKRQTLRVRNTCLLDGHLNLTFFFPNQKEIIIEHNSEILEYLLFIGVELYLLEEAEKKQFTNFCEVIHSSDGRNYS
eukprot:gene9987-6970_t